MIASSSSICGLNGTALNPFISWDKSFTKVSPANPGAKQEQPGICNNLQLLLTIGQGQDWFENGNLLSLKEYILSIAAYL